MFRQVLTPAPIHSPGWRESWGRLLAPVTLWIFVTVTLRYGVYGDRQMVLWPGSTRLLKASSVFVEQVEIRDHTKKGVFVYGFTDKPELSLETNCSVSDYMIVSSYSRKGFSWWLNKGSRIRIRWETQTSTMDRVQPFLIKGEHKYETLLPMLSTSIDPLNLGEPFNGKEAEFMIEEDDRYYIGLLNTNPKSIIMKVTVNVTLKLHDLSKARNMCSTLEGSCQLMLLFPKTQYIVVSTPDTGDTGGWYVELSFVARVVTYVVILGIIIIIIFLVLKYLGGCDPETNLVETAVRQVSGTEPILPMKSAPLTYGTNEEEEEGSPSSSSEDLYDAKLCVICYDDQRNCFFVPCGHCAICYTCAQRIMKEENKICPICRRLIHKVRRLFTP